LSVLPGSKGRRVLAALRGSSWPVLVDCGDQRLVVKLRGTAEGLAPLVSEIVVGAIADVLGLATPARFLVELPEHVPSDDPHEELRDLLDRSAGLNLGLAYLDGFRNVTPADASRIDPELAASIAWLDWLVQNPDRTAKNPNLMIKAGKIQLIDHGAALSFHYDWSSVTEQTPRVTGEILSHHLLAVSRQQLLAADRKLAPKIKRETLAQALSEVPDAFLQQLSNEACERQRAAYVAYLWKRLDEPRWLRP
jgi:hypothetical protein